MGCLLIISGGDYYRAVECRSIFHAAARVEEEEEEEEEEEPLDFVKQSRRHNKRDSKTGSLILLLLLLLWCPVKWCRNGDIIIVLCNACKPR